MRETELIEREISDLDAIIQNASNLAKQFPNDNLIAISIQQAQHRKEMLIEERNNRNSSVSKNIFFALYFYITSLFNKSSHKKGVIQNEADSLHLNKKSTA
ncbi:MAG TPA: hypothetical protein PL045_02900 [Chitinophagaceae bacterium]|nr:hypothetical protein [Chitinophagaceae bacterium]